jgi:hypothetical protein
MDAIIVAKPRCLQAGRQLGKTGKGEFTQPSAHPPFNEIKINPCVTYAACAKE